jgi:hypothetical protein
MTAMLGLAAGPCLGQSLLATRTAAVNGRQVLEVRMGIVPGTQALRTLVVTAGPVSGSTSLLTSVTPPGQVMNSGAPMLFSVVVNAGSLFSLGGGCPRAGELNFPYIDGLQFRVVRYTGTTQTIVTPPVFAAQYEGVNCTTSANGQAVFYTLANRTTGRIEVWREGAGNAFTRVHAGVAAIRLPFNGGLRPQISRMARLIAPSPSIEASPKGGASGPYESNHVLVFYQNADGSLKIDVVNTGNQAVEGECFIGSRTAGPPPFEAALTPDLAAGDFNGDGITDIVSISPSVGGLCQLGGVTRQLGSSTGGNGYTWTGVALAGDTVSKEYRALHGGGFARLQSGAFELSASPFSGRGGPFHGAHLGPGEYDPGLLAVGTAASNTALEFFAFAPAFSGGIFVSSFEDPVSGETISIEVAPQPR